MNTFKKKTLCAALAGFGALGMVGAAQAVSLNPDGLGQVLIYPYYTVRANADGEAFNSLFSVVNSTAAGKAVKVRFLEGKASHEVLDFNLYLSPHDVWTAAIFATADGAAVKTSDTSCTFGNLAALGDAGQAFRNTLFSGSLADGEDDTLDRTREGYVELIEMGEVTDTATGVTPAFNTLAAITHVTGADGKRAPANCAAIVDGGSGSLVTGTQASAANAWAAATIVSPTGGLFGGMTVINPKMARAAGYDAVALSGFFTADWTATGVAGFDNARVPETLWFPSGDMNPNLSMASPASSDVLDTVANTIDSQDWTGSAYAGVNSAPPANGWVITDNIQGARAVYLAGLDATTATLMRSTIMNEYMTANSVGGATDWVITMPTKGLYFDRDVNRLAPRALFQNNFAKNGSCDAIGFEVYDREELTKAPAPGEGWSPVVIGQTPGASLCWEANVVEIKGPSSADRSFFHAKNVNQMTVAYDNGWAILTVQDAAGSSVATPTGGTAAVTTAYAAHGLTISGDVIAAGTTASTNAATYFGLPMVGFATQLFNNQALDTVAHGKVWASYASTMGHRYERTINP